MEPVTHILTGACLARTGLNRRAAYATAAMAIAAEFPDIDTLWSLRGPVASFQHHRGITHTFLGVPAEAALIVGGLFLVHRWRVRRRQAQQPNSDSIPYARPLTAAPVRWGTLYLFALLALLSHLLLDYTNNYGIRPFFPFNPRWYAASITFIFDPVMFVVLLAALVLPAIFRLVGSEVGARRQPFTAPGWSILALLCVVSLWVLREVEHNAAVQLAMMQSLAITQDSATPAESSYVTPQKVLANPDPFSPFRWWTVTDFGSLYQLGQASTISGALFPAQQAQPKPAYSPPLAAAEKSALGRVYMDWSPMPFIDVIRSESAAATGRDLAPGHKLVVFRDPRFMGDIPLMRGRTPLQATVELDGADHVVREVMDGKEQH